MIQVLLHEALRLRRQDPETFTDEVLAARFKVSVNELRRSIESLRRRQARKNQLRDERTARARKIEARPVDEAFRRRREHLAYMERADTRDLTGILCGDPLFIRSALYQRQKQNA